MTESTITTDRRAELRPTPDRRAHARDLFVEFRGEDPTVPIKELHKMTEAQVRKEMSIHSLEWSETLTPLPRQHIIIFKNKPVGFGPPNK